MIAYFTASVSAKDKYLTNYQAIINHFQKLGCNVVYEHIINASEEKIRLFTKEERLRFHENVVRWIHKCDFLVADTSMPSTSVGYEIALALRAGKPVLVLHSVGDAPSLLGQHKDEKMVVEKYTMNNLGQIVDDFMSYVQGKHDLRFTFFITPSIVAFLDMIAKKQKLPKSVYLRNLIEREMEKMELDM